MQRKISREIYHWEKYFNKYHWEMQFPLNIVFKRDLNDNYKVRQLVFRKYDSLFYHKVRQELLQSSTVLLQNVTGITVKV